jgi:uncharacterized SAM-binding protein YcdF (DUF218 family)
MMAGAAGVSLFILGFVVFANSASRRESTGVHVADAIVVLTGADKRIDEGFRLLREGLGRRLLISGINPHTKPWHLQRLANPGEALFECCVDFGYIAQNTVGNASETKAWAEHYGFSRIIVVTSSYHMARSLTELGRVLPNVELIAHPVVPRILRDEPWWLHMSTMRILVGEYLKLIPSAARFVAARLIRPRAASPGPSVAVRSAL